MAWSRTKRNLHQNKGQEYYDKGHSSDTVVHLQNSRAERGEVEMTAMKRVAGELESGRTFREISVLSPAEGVLHSGYWCTWENAYIATH